MIIAAVGIMLGAFLAVPAAQGATFEATANGDVVAVVAAGDSFGRIVAQYRTALKKQDRVAYEKSGFAGSLWGTNGVVKAVAEQTQGIDDINKIHTGDRLVIVKGVEAPTTVLAAVVSSEGESASTQNETMLTTAVRVEAAGALTKSLRNISDQPNSEADLTLPGGLSDDSNQQVSSDVNAGARTWRGTIDGPSQKEDRVDADINTRVGGETGSWGKTAQVLSSVKGSGLGWYQGVTSVGLLLLTMLRLAGGGRKERSENLSRLRQATEEKRLSSQQNMLRKKC